MCDQVVALISSEHANTIVWSEEDEKTGSMNAENNESDRLFAFEVAKTNEQEETVTFRPGFQVCRALFHPLVDFNLLQLISRNIAIHDTSPESSIDLEPRLLLGETIQGFMSSRYQPARRSTEPFKNKPFYPLQLRELLYVLESNERHRTKRN